MILVRLGKKLILVSQDQVTALILQIQNYHFRIEIIFFKIAKTLRKKNLLKIA